MSPRLLCICVLLGSVVAKGGGNRGGFSGGGVSSKYSRNSATNPSSTTTMYAGAPYLLLRRRRYSAFEHNHHQQNHSTALRASDTDHGLKTFTCKDNQTISRWALCDGYADCQDHSDEFAPSPCKGACSEAERLYYGLWIGALTIFIYAFAYYTSNEETVAATDEESQTSLLQTIRTRILVTIMVLWICFVGLVVACANKDQTVYDIGLYLPLSVSAMGAIAVVWTFRTHKITKECNAWIYPLSWCMFIMSFVVYFSLYAHFSRPYEMYAKDMKTLVQWSTLPCWTDNQSWCVNSLDGDRYPDAHNITLHRTPFKTTCNQTNRTACGFSLNLTETMHVHTIAFEPKLISNYTVYIRLQIRDIVTRKPTTIFSGPLRQVALHEIIMDTPLQTDEVRYIVDKTTSPNNSQAEWGIADMSIWVI